MIVDSNIAVIATEQIGEAWALVILEQIALGNIEAQSDCLFALELLDGYWAKNKSYEGKRLYKAFRKIIGDHFLEVRLSDFEKSRDLFVKYKNVKARELLHSAVALRSHSNKIFSIDGPQYSQVNEINLIDLKKLLRELNLEGDYVKQRHG